MIVHGPAAVCHDVFKLSLAFYIVLGQGIVADIAAAFALARQNAYPVQAPVPVAFAQFGRVFDIIPQPIGNLEQFIADSFRIVNGIPIASQLQIPEIFRRAGHIGDAVGKVFLGKARRPVRGDKLAGGAFLARLDHAAHAHGLPVTGRDVPPDALPKIAFAFTAQAIRRPAERRKDAVAGTIRKQPRVDTMILLGGHPPAGDRGNAPVLHGAVVDRTIKQELNIFLFPGQAVQDAIPHRVVLVRVAVQVFQHQLLNDPGFQHVFAPRAAHPHANLAGCVSAQHGALLHQGGLDPPARSGNSGA